MACDRHTNINTAATGAASSFWMSIKRSGRLTNCSLTTYVPADEGGLRLDRDAWVALLREHAAPVTDEPDAAVASR